MLLENLLHPGQNRIEGGRGLAGQNYDSLIAYLKSDDNWAHVLKSSFMVKTSLTAGQLRDGITQHIDTNDDVLVVNVEGKGWGSWGLGDELNTWLQSNL